MKTFEELSQKQKELYRWCLEAAAFDKDKAIQYFNTEAIPLEDVIRMSNRLLRMWSEDQEELNASDKRMWELEFKLVTINKEGKLLKIKGGKTSKRKPDTSLMDSAKKIISEIRKDLKYKVSYNFEGHSAKYLWIKMKKKGFQGSEAWVKKHFATITKLA